MLVENLESLLSTSASEVLETMFFTCVLGELPDVESSPGAISTELDFRGDCSGSFGLSLSPESAVTIAANFLGEEESELPPGRTGEVVCELTNMICGSLLSRLESSATFELRHPELAPMPDSFTAYRTFELDSGVLTVWLTLH